MPTPTHGSIAKFTYSGQDLTAAMQGEIATEQEVTLVDKTVFGDTAESHTVSPIKKNSPIPFEIQFDVTLHNALKALVGTTNAAAYSPQGTTAGLPQETGSATLNKYKVTSPRDGLSMIQGEVTPSGTWTWGVAP